MYAFEYVKPGSVDDAVALLSANLDAKPMSGGMTLIPTLKQRLAQPSHLVDIGGLAALQGITREGDTLVVGAGSTHVSVARSAVVKEAIPALAALADQIGDPAVRNRGTMGGSLANNDPAADYPSAALALGATIVTNKRKIAADDFFQGMFTTALEEAELVTQIRFPIPKRAAYSKFPHPASGYAMTGVFVAETAGGVRVAVTGAGPSVFRWVEAENALSKGFSVASLAALKHPADGLNEDIHAPAAYRANLIDVMTRRAVAQLTGEKA